MKKWTSKSIRAFRNKHHMTQEELAILLGCRQQTVSEWETELYTPKNAYSQLLDQVEEYFSSQNPKKQFAIKQKSALN
jgi:DNA-binding transcriptional regulator YiaG